MLHLLYMLLSQIALEFGAHVKLKSNVQKGLLQCQQPLKSYLLPLSIWFTDLHVDLPALAYDVSSAVILCFTMRSKACFRQQCTRPGMCVGMKCMADNTLTSHVSMIQPQ